jgi:hypothetical protein
MRLPAKSEPCQKGRESEAKATTRELLTPQVKLSDMRKRMLFVQDNIWKNVAVGAILWCRIGCCLPADEAMRLFRKGIQPWGV